MFDWTHVRRSVSLGVFLVVMAIVFTGCNPVVVTPKVTFSPTTTAITPGATPSPTGTEVTPSLVTVVATVVDSTPPPPTFKTYGTCLLDTSDWIDGMLNKSSNYSVHVDVGSLGEEYELRFSIDSIPVYARVRLIADVLQATVAGACVRREKLF